MDADEHRTRFRRPVAEFYAEGVALVVFDQSSEGDAHRGAGAEHEHEQIEGVGHGAHDLDLAFPGGGLQVGDNGHETEGEAEQREPDEAHAEKGDAQKAEANGEEDGKHSAGGDKFIIIDADTDQPTIYTGSANLSKNSTNHNDENLLEITGSTALARTYLAEFMRIYEHYRARALWNIAHPAAAKPSKSGSRASKKKALPPAAAKRIEQTFTLKKTRDAWVKDAYKRGTPAYLERQTLAHE